jgi:hypothetical protein
VTRWRPWLLAPVAFLLAAAPYRESRWYSIAAENGRPIGYGYAKVLGPLDHLTLTYHLEFTADDQTRGATRITDHMVVEIDNDGRPREMTERITIGGERTDVRAIIDGGEAVVTRTTHAGVQTERIALPQRTFAYDMFAPSRCVPPSDEREPFFELNAAEMAVDRVVDGALSSWGAGGVRTMPRERFGSDRLRATERIGYDGDCHLVEVAKTAFGVAVRITPSDRETALKRAMASR